MIKSNWPIKNLIMFFDLIFMQVHPIIILYDLEFPSKLQPDFYIFLKFSSACFLHVVILYFVLYFFLKTSEFWKITHNWVMTSVTIMMAEKSRQRLFW